MKKYNFILCISIIVLLNGCTLITAPIEVAGAVAGAVIDVGSASVRAVTGSDDD